MLHSLRSAAALASLALILGVALTLSAADAPYADLAAVTDDEYLDLYPAVSPDGAHLAYMSRRDGFDILLKTLDSPAVARLRDDPADEGFPAWSPDGRTVYFDATLTGRRRVVWKKDLAAPAAPLPELPPLAFGVDVNAAGRLAFAALERPGAFPSPRGVDFWKSWKRRPPHLYLADGDGANLVDLRVAGFGPKWNPTGDRLAFAAARAGNFDIYTVAADGADLHRLTVRDAVDVEPAWSPDGRTLVFASNDGGQWDLWTIAPDGSGLAPLTRDPASDGGPAWAADGFIYFHTDRGGHWDIWRLKPTAYAPPPPAPTDADGDGIPAADDRCPDRPEDVDGFQDADGCPDPDNDADGVPDVDDGCVGEPEDADGFDDADGCPDPDNDADGIADLVDQCPNEPETVNLFRDDDGCPDQPPLRNGDLLPIEFPEKSDNLTGEADLATLAAFAENLVQMPTVRVTLRVYTDTRSARERPGLTRRRANAIRAALEQNGISPDRCAVVGMDDAAPLASNIDPAGRRKNNRVVIEISVEDSAK